MKKVVEMMLLAFVIVMIGCNAPSVAGKVDETDTQLPGLISPAGMPVAGAKVKLFKSQDTTGTVVDSMVTDANGKYSLEKIPDGVYAIWAETDSLVFFKDEIVLTDSTTYRSTDTLEQPRTILVPVTVEPQHSPQIIMAQILGTNEYPLVQPSSTNRSYLVLDRVPNGSFTVRLAPANPNKHEYTPRSWPIAISDNSPDTVAEVWHMEYTGIPVVKGVAAQFDTLTGIASVSWEPTPFSLFSRYEIYRDLISAPSLSTQPIASTSEPLYNDSLVANGVVPGTYIYRIKIRNSAGEVGVHHYVDTITYVDPAEELNILKSTAVGVNFRERVKIPLNVSSWFGETPQGTIAINGGAAQPLSSFDTVAISIDSLIGESIPVVVAISGDNRTVVDTILLNVTLAWNKIGTVPTAGTALQPLRVGESIYLPVIAGNRYYLYRSDDSCRQWNLLSDSAVATSPLSAASNPVAQDGWLWIVDGVGNLCSSLDGTLWTVNSSAPVDPFWEGLTETKILASVNGTLELAIDNSHDRTSGGTELTFWRYNRTAGVFDSTGKLREYLNHYWIESDETGVSLYTFDEKSSRRAIDRYTVSNGVVQTGTLNQNSEDLSFRSTSYRHLSMTRFCGKQLFVDGRGANQFLAVNIGQQWNPNLIAKAHAVGTVPTTLPVQLITMGNTLWMVNAEGVFAGQ